MLLLLRCNCNWQSVAIRMIDCLPPAGRCSATQERAGSSGVASVTWQWVLLPPDDCRLSTVACPCPWAPAVARHPLVDDWQLQLMRRAVFAALGKDALWQAAAEPTIAASEQPSSCSLHSALCNALPNWHASMHRWRLLAALRHAHTPLQLPPGGVGGAGGLGHLRGACSDSVAGRALMTRLCASCGKLS